MGCAYFEPGDPYLARNNNNKVEIIYIYIVNELILFFYISFLNLNSN